MKVIRVLVAASVLLAVSAFAAGPKVVGAWNGKIKFDMARILAKNKPENREMIKKSLAAADKFKLGLNLKANHTFTLTITGGPAKQPVKGEGTWTMQGNKLTMLQTKQGGKPVQKRTPQILTVAKNGRSMYMVIPGGQGKKIFTKV